MTNNSIHVVGNSVFDIFVHDVPIVAQNTIDSITDTWGTNVQRLANPPSVSLGGGGASAAYVLASLGANVSLNTNIGNDFWGRLLQSWLQDIGVTICSAPASTSPAHIITLTPQGQRRSFYHMGEKVHWQRSLEITPSRWLLVSGHSNVNAQDGAVLGQFFSALKARGSFIVFDPSPWFNKHISTSTMHALWHYVDYLVGTEEELAFWSPAPADTQTLALRLLQLGPPNVVLKRGREGAFFCSRDGQSGSVTTKALLNVNTVGAGDIFNGCLVYWLSQDKPLLFALQQAVETATNAVAHGGGVMGLTKSKALSD